MQHVTQYASAWTCCLSPYRLFTQKFCGVAFILDHEIMQIWENWKKYVLLCLQKYGSMAAILDYEIVKYWLFHKTGQITKFWVLNIYVTFGLNPFNHSSVIALTNLCYGCTHGRMHAHTHRQPKSIMSLPQVGRGIVIINNGLQRVHWWQDTAGGSRQCLKAELAELSVKKWGMPLMG
jgi:hypothetical protein